MAKVRRSGDDQHHAQDHVSCDHNLGSELIAKSLFTVGAEDSKECKEEDSRKEDNNHHGVSKMNVESNRAVERHEPVQNRVGKTRNRKATHGERDQGHLKENGVH